jgi:voltage-gated potassium channel
MAEPVREYFGTRWAIGLTTAVAVLSFVTGVIFLTTGVSGPLTPYVPTLIRATAGFTGTLTGFLMLATAYALRRGYRLGWTGAVVLLPVTAVQGLVQTSTLSLPLIVLSLLALPTVALNRGRFTRSLAMSTTQKAALAALVGTQIYGTVGAWTLRDQFSGVASLTDALYYTIVTASTVGYGDATPVSARARLFGISIVLLGTASFAIALGSVLGPAIESRLSQALGTMSDADFDLLEDHVIVLGYGDLTEPLLEELAGHAEFVVVTPDQSTAATLRQRDITVYTGDPSDVDPLDRVQVTHARAAIAATNVDAEDAFAILTARQLNPDLRIVAAATDRENVEKLKRAGADAVISPAVLGGHLLVESALEDADVEDVADDLLEED